MKKYLNSAQKNDFIRLAALEAAADDICLEWGSHDFLTTNEKKWLKTVVSLVKKVLVSILTRLADDEGNAIMRRAKGTQVICIPRESEAAFRKRMEQELSEEHIYIHREALDAIIEMSLCKGCSPCTWGDKQNCPLRAAMIELDVPKYDTAPPDGGCPWEIIL